MKSRTGLLPQKESWGHNAVGPRRHESMDKIKMGKFLSDLRGEKNLRQQDEADIFQVSPQAISKWESGDSIPDIATLEKLSSFFNVGIDEIINGERKNTAADVKTNTVVVARNPTMEERGLGKEYYGVFIYCMSALLLALIFACIPFVYLYVTTVNYLNYYISANFYEVLFKSSGLLTVCSWLATLFFLASVCMSIGLWLDKTHRKTYWWLSFYFALAALVIIVFAFFFIVFSENERLEVSFGFIIFVIFGALYFILFCSLPICRRSRFVPKNVIANIAK